MRLNLRLNGAAEELMDKLSKKFGITPKDAIIDSLAILNLAVDEIERNGGRLVIQRDDEIVAIATPTLLALQKLSGRVTEKKKPPKVARPKQIAKKKELAGA